MSLTKATYSMIDGAPANVLDFGATGDGTTDDSAAIQAAVNASRSVYFPQPTGAFYRCNSPIVLRQDNVIVGANKQNTVVKFFGCSGFTATSSGPGAYDIQVRNLFIEGDGVGATSDGLVIDGTSANFGRVDVDNVVISGFGRDGLKFIKPIVSQIRLVQSSNNGRHGFYLKGDGTSVFASTSYASLNGGDGWYIEDNLQYSAFDACASDSNTGNGWNFNGTTAVPAEGITLTSCGSETNLGDQFKFTCTLALTLNGIFTFPGSPAAGGNFLTLNGAKQVSINGVRMAATAPVGKYALFLDTVGGLQFPGDISLNGCDFSSTNATTDQIIDVNALPRFSKGSDTYSDGDTITHGLGITPNNVFISTGSATTQAAATNITSTTFDITIYDVASSPAVPVINQACKWQASWQA
jgi:hypothetical protein